MIYDCLHRFLQVFVYFVILAIDRSTNGHAGHDIDKWIDINMMILFLEMMVRCIAIPKVDT